MITFQPVLNVNVNGENKTQGVTLMDGTEIKAKAVMAYQSLSHGGPRQIEVTDYANQEINNCHRTILHFDCEKRAF